jgi:uncharacterized membrane-anchored protein YjiN (DUF445 family)
MISGRNRIGIISCAAAFAGFLFFTFQPWIPLETLRVFGTLNARTLLSAFFDASLVGALADWFAVTALFKNPLGVRLPHTDILARNKDAIAEAVPRFLTSFVSEEKVAEQLAVVDFGAKVAQLLEQRTSRGEINAFVRTRLTRLLESSRGAEKEPSESFLAVVQEIVGFAGARIDAARAVGALLSWSRDERIDEQLIEGAADALRGGVSRNLDQIADTLTPMLKRNAGWQGIFVGRGTVERLLRGVQEELERFRSDKAHDLRILLRQRLQFLSAQLAAETSLPQPARDRLRASFHAFVADPATAARVSRVIALGLDQVRASLRSENSGFTEGVDRMENVLVTQLKENREFRLKFNAGVAGLVSSLIARSGLIESVTGYLAGLLKNTDEREFVRRVEDAVWNDLQYIRVNGAVVGGLVGVLLAVFSSAFHK